MDAGHVEATGDRVLCGVIDNARAHVVVSAVVGGDHVAGIVSVSFHSLLHGASLCRAPIVVPAYVSRIRIMMAMRMDMSC